MSYNNDIIHLMNTSQKHLLTCRLKTSIVISVKVLGGLRYSWPGAEVLFLFVCY